jgi:hypothetical protein
MGEAKRKKKAREHGRHWAWFPGNEHDPVKGLTLDEALNCADYYTVEQAKEAIPNMLPWHVNRMKISDKRYESVKLHCLKAGFLNVGHFDFGSYIKWNPN